VEYKSRQRLSADKLRTKLGKDVKEAIIEFCNTPKSRGDIRELLGIKTDLADDKFINSLVRSGRLFYTVPEVPPSPQQHFVNANAKRYVKSNEAVLKFCDTPRRSEDIAKFIGVEYGAARRNYLRPLVESGRLKRTEPEGSAYQRYVNAEAEMSPELLFKVDIIEALIQRYGNNEFTVNDIVGDFKVSADADAARLRINRLKEDGKLNYQRKRGEVCHTVRKL
jgi:hypothetical protein